MWKTIARRILILIPQLILLSLVMFFLASRMPGDALSGLIDQNIRAERLEVLRLLYGFYDPWYVRYVRWLGNMMHGDFGTSMVHKLPVLDLIGVRAANTFRLSLLSMAITYMIAVPLGIISGKYHEKFPDKIISFYAFITLAFPTVFMAVIMLYIFAYRFRIFPAGRTVDIMAARGTIEFYVSRLYHMILPAITFALISTTGIIVYLRNEIIDFENSDFVVTARAKGVPEKIIYNKHILRNSLIPLASNFGFVITGLLTGSIFIESVFVYPGMGLLFLDSVVKRDYSTVNILILFMGALIVLGGLLSDIILTIVDPRIRIK